MGIFNLFKKTQSEKDNSTSHSLKPERNTNVPINKINEGNHGDHWAGIFGFNNFYSNPNIGSKLLSALSNDAKKSEISKNYEELNFDFGEVEFIAIMQKQKIQTSYPIIKSQDSVESITKVIKEWNHVNGIEAQIEAKCKNTFGISYFATDYLKHKDEYCSNFSLNIQLSGIAFSIHPAGQMEGMADNFVGYMPSKEFGKYSVIDSLGEIVQLKEIRISDFQIEGFLAKIKLIQMEKDSDFFCLDTFINKENIQTEGLTIGSRISGMIWIQGRLAQ
jgi:hypothetical protein